MALKGAWVSVCAYTAAAVQGGEEDCEGCAAHNVSRSTCFVKLEQEVPGLLDRKQ